MKTTKQFSVKSWVGIFLVALLLGGGVFFLTKQLSTPQEKIPATTSSSEVVGKDSQPDNGKNKQDPMKDLPDQDEVNLGTINSTEPLLVPNPNVDNMIPEPNQTDVDPQLTALKRALRIQNEIYFLMSRNFLDESEPNAKAQIEKDLKAVKQKIDELQKAIDKLEKK